MTYTSSYETASSMTQLKIDPNTCKISITKIDAQTKDKLENVVFEVFNENDESLGTYKTDKQGSIEINNLKPGTVKIKEIETDSRYILNDEPIEVNLNWGETAKIEIANKRKKGDLRIVKSDLDDKNIKLEGVEFELYNDKNELIEKLVTNKEGEATIKSIDIGEYTLKEVKTNEEYVLNSEKIDLQIEWNKETTLNIENKKIEKPKLPRTGF